MKVIAKPIQMIAWFDIDGTPNPIRLKIENEDKSFSVINIDRIILRNKEKLAGNDMLIFRCQSCINNTMKIFEIKYELRTCKWLLYKI